MSDEILTIGHSTHSIERFLGLLAACSVTAVADVRSAPYSRYAPQFNRDPLRGSLAEAGIKYVFMGRELGARSTDPTCYDHGRVRYDRLAQTTAFQEGLARLVEGSRLESVAIMCTEKDPLDCHRTLLVSQALAQRGVRVRHVLPDGTTESHDEALLRLLDRSDESQPDLFSTHDERLARALSAQEARIAYVDADLASASTNSD